MRNRLVVLLFAGLFTACVGDEAPIELSAITDLEFEAMVVDSADDYVLGLTVTNIGQTTVRISGSSCLVTAMIREAPDSDLLLPGVPPEGYHGVFCTFQNQLDFDLDPGESWTYDRIFIPMYEEELVERVVSQPHWYAVGIYAGLIEGIDEPHIVDIGWVQMPLPRGWPTDG